MMAQQDGNTVIDHTTQSDDGFSLMEMVIGVSVILIIVVAGFFSIQGITNNARDSVVETAAQSVFQAAFSSHTSGIGKSFDEIIEEYNDTSGEDLIVDIIDAQGELTVTASGWDGRHVAVRSTDIELDGTEELPKNLENVTDLEGRMVLEWDVSYDDDGTIKLPIHDVHKDGIIVNWGDGTVTDKNVKSHTYTGDDRNSIQEIVIEGQFKAWGSSGLAGREDKRGLLAVTTWDNTGTNNLSSGFYYAQELTHIKEIPLNVEGFSSMFRSASNFDQDISDWDISNTSSLGNMFQGATLFDNGGKPLDWDTSHITSMSSMFFASRSFNQDIGDWETGKVETMQAMFFNATSFNHDISDWDVSNVTHMGSMFSDNGAFNNGGVSLDWEDTSNVKDMTSMFYGASGFNQDISNWKTGKVTTMSHMFFKASAFNNGAPSGESSNVGLNNWDTSSVRQMSLMFFASRSFNQDISEWQTGNVKRMDSMFRDNTSFNQDISSWDVRNVTSMSRMFHNARNFKQDLSNWDVMNVTSYENFSNNLNIIHPIWKH